MIRKLNCILLISEDRLTNFVNKIVIDKANCTDQVVRMTSAMAGLLYLTDSARTPDIIPFPDLIFLDMDMPGLNGDTFLVKYAGIKHVFPSQPIIIMLTSFGELFDILLSPGSAEVADIYYKRLTETMVRSIIYEYFTEPVNN